MVEENEMHNSYMKSKDIYTRDTTDIIHEQTEMAKVAPVHLSGSQSHKMFVLWALIGSCTIEGSRLP
jgi:hypothetical protein